MSTDKPIEPKAREFRLIEFREREDLPPTRLTAFYVGEKINTQGTLIRVIEYKALQQCQEELKEAKTELSGLRKTSEFLDAQYYKQRNELSALQAELKETKRKYEEAEQSERELSAEYYKGLSELKAEKTALESANKELQQRLNDSQANSCSDQNKCAAIFEANSLLSAKLEKANKVIEVIKEFQEQVEANKQDPQLITQITIEKNNDYWRGYYDACVCSVDLVKSTIIEYGQELSSVVPEVKNV